MNGGEGGNSYDGLKLFTLDRGFMYQGEPKVMTYYIYALVFVLDTFFIIDHSRHQRDAY